MNIRQKVFLLISLVIVFLVGCKHSSTEISNKKVEAVINQLIESINSQEYEACYQLIDDDFIIENLRDNNRLRKLKKDLNEIQSYQVIEVDKEYQYIKIKLIGKVSDAEIEMYFGSDNQYLIKGIKINGKVSISDVENNKELNEFVKSVLTSIVEEDYSYLFSRMEKPFIDGENNKIDSVRALEEMIQKNKGYYGINQIVKYYYNIKKENEAVVINSTLKNDIGQGINISFNLQYLNGFKISNFSFDEINALIAKKAIFHQEISDKLEYMDQKNGVISHLYEKNNSEYFHNSLQNVFEFEGRLEEDRGILLYSFMSNSFIDALDFKDTKRYISLMKKRVGFDEEFKKSHINPLFNLSYSQPFYANHLVRLLPKSNSRLICYFEMQEKIMNINEITGHSVMENIYFFRLKTEEIFTEKILESIDESVFDLKSKELITALREYNYEKLWQIEKKYTKFESKKEYLEFLNLQKKLIGSFNGPYIKKYSKMGESNRYRIDEWVFKSSSGDVGRLIITFNGKQEIISYNIAKLIEVRDKIERTN